MPKTRAALLAGFIAISANAIVLKLATCFGIVAESGGLLKLHVLYLSPMVKRTGISSWWTAHHLPGPSSIPFWLAFHYLTGFVMVFLYTSLLEPVLPGRGLAKGTIFSLLPWMINVLLVLPMLGQGAFGVRALAVSGIVYFFAANWLFGAALGVLYEKYRIESSR